MILYSTNCPKCMVLERKLNEKGVAYTIENDVQTMLDKGIESAPALEVDGKIYGFSAAISWLSAQ